jgi:hypothetical protein
MGHIMLKKVLLLALFNFLVLDGCASRYQLTRIEPTDDYVNRKIEVRTQKGQKHILISYKITETKIIGKDIDGKQYEELVENIKSITVLRKQGIEELIGGITVVGLVVLIAFGVSINKAFR